MQHHYDATSHRNNRLTVYSRKNGTHMHAQIKKPLDRDDMTQADGGTAADLIEAGKAGNKFNTMYCSH